MFDDFEMDLQFLSKHIRNFILIEYIRWLTAKHKKLRKPITVCFSLSIVAN